MATEINNHVAQAIDRLVQQYKGKERIEGLITAFVTGTQNLESVYQDLLANRAIDTSFGTNLDRIGDIVGISRNYNEIDDDYRIRINTQILINISNGEPERAIEIFQRLTGASLVIYGETFPAGVTVFGDASKSDQDEINQIFTQMERVVPAGVRIDHLGEFDTNEPFSMDGSLPGFGFGDLNDASIGGKLGSLWIYNQIEFAFGSLTVADQDATGGGFGTIDDVLVGGVLKSL